MLSCTELGEMAIWSVGIGHGCQGHTKDEELGIAGTLVEVHLCLVVWSPARGRGRGWCRFDGFADYKAGGV